MISKKAEKMLTDLKHVVRSASGSDDEFFTTEFEIRMYFLANYILGLEMRETDYKKRIAELEEQLLDADERYTFLVDHEATLAEELGKRVAEAEEHVLDAEAEYFHIAERLDAKEQEVAEYKECCSRLMGLLANTSKTTLTLLIEKGEWNEIITEAGDYIERLIEVGNKLANVWSVRGFVEVEEWNKATAEWEDEMSEELRPCPFCGGKAQTVTPSFDPDDLEFMNFDEVDDSYCFDVTCSNVRCINGWWLTPKAWNTRPIEDDLRKRIAELEHDLSNKEIEYTDLWDDMLEMQARIAELEGFINQLIEAGDAVINAYPDWIREEDDWDALVEDWKEG